MWSRLEYMSDQGRPSLLAYFRAQSDLKDFGEAEETSRFKLFWRVMGHQGLDTLRFQSPDGVLPIDVAFNIGSKIWELPLEQVSDENVWDSEDLETREQIGWHSSACDEREIRRQSRCA